MRPPGKLNQRTIVYIDGFNLYYGVLRTQYSRYKWLDFDAYFTKLLPKSNIVAIKYFSALADRKRNPAGRARQKDYWKALGSLKLTKVIAGRFKDKSVKCDVSACMNAGNRWFQVPEEKRTDVNIALEILDDAYRGEMDEVVLVSGDSDLAPALQKLRQHFPGIFISLYVPAAFNPIRGKAPDLRRLANKDRNFDGALCAHTQLPDPVVLADGTTVNRPATW